MPSKFQIAALAEMQPTEEYAEAMNKAIADAAEAEAQRDAAQARVAELTKPPVLVRSSLYTLCDAKSAKGLGP